MTQPFQIGDATLHLGDCREVLKRLEDQYVDSIVTDPPAGISFMSAKWDGDKGGRNQWIVWMADIAAECLRVIKPGGHALVWALPRTSHWTATAWENAGWEVRDRVAHIFSQGFPKSRNLEGEWEGWGTSLKPAVEDWWLLRKPLIGTVAHNVDLHGTGALNIDGCRVEPTGESRERDNEDSQDRRYIENGGTNFAAKPGIRGGDPAGRWPANIIHDGSEEVLATFPDAKGQQGAVTGQEPSSKTNNVYGQFNGRPASTPRGDTGSAARFFYAAKASTREKNEGLPAGMLNSHPTPKSLSLMRYLCRLITPPSGTVLDCFAGSGSTGVAALKEGFRFIGIEQSPEYYAIACERLGRQQSETILPMAKQEPEREPDLFSFTAA